MTVQVEVPQQLLRFVDANGRLTLEGIIVFQKMVEKLNDLEARVIALEP